MKRFQKLAGGLAVVVLCLLLMCGSAAAASNKSKALKKYKSLLEGMGDSARFAVILFDNDSVPELCVTKGMKSELYTYKSGKLKKLELEFSTCYFDEYYKKKGVLVQMWVHANIYSSTHIHYYHKLSGSKLVHKLVYTEMWDKDGKKTNDYRKADGKLLTKKTFSKKLTAMTGGKKKTKIKMYNNTAANRKKYLK